MEPVPFKAFLASLQPVGAAPTLDPATRAEIQAAADAITELPEISREALAGLIREHPRCRQ